MVRKNTRRIVQRSVQRSVRMRPSVETRIIEDPQAISSYPHCPLPADYFERGLSLAKQRDGLLRHKNIMSITTWDGRRVMSIDAPE